MLLAAEFLCHVLCSQNFILKVNMVNKEAGEIKKIEADRKER